MPKRKHVLAGAVLAATLTSGVLIGSVAADKVEPADPAAGPPDSKVVASTEVPLSDADVSEGAVDEEPSDESPLQPPGDGESSDPEPVAPAEPEVDEIALWFAEHDAELQALLARGEELSAEAREATGDPERQYQVAAEMHALSEEFGELAATADDFELRSILRDIRDSLRYVAWDIEDFALGYERGDLNKMERANQSLARHVSEQGEALDALSALRAAHS